MTQPITNPTHPERNRFVRSLVAILQRRWVLGAVAIAAILVISMRLGFSYYQRKTACREIFFRINGWVRIRERGPDWLTAWPRRNGLSLLVDAVDSVHLEETAISDADLRLIWPLSELHTLILRDTKITDAGIARLPPFREIRELSLSGTNVTDACLAKVGGYQSLRELNLNWVLLTDAGCTHLARLSDLEVLTLCGTQVTDIGLERLTRLTMLQDLWLNGTGVTDAGLMHVKRLPELRYLYVYDTATSEEGIAELKRALPRLAVYNERNPAAMQILRPRQCHFAVSGKRPTGARL